MDSDYHKAVFMQCLCLWTANNALIFAVLFSMVFVAYHVTFYSVVETPTLPQVVLNNFRSSHFVWEVSAKISYLNFQANHVRAQLNKFTKM